MHSDLVIEAFGARFTEDSYRTRPRSWRRWSVPCSMCRYGDHFAGRRDGAVGGVVLKESLGGADYPTGSAGLRANPLGAED